MKTVLVAEDESSIREFITINLRLAGYDIIEACDGMQAIEKYDANKNIIDIAVLDIMMPGCDGIEVCKHIRENNFNIGVIFLTAKTQEHDKVSGLISGADDYIPKPFSIHEVVARVTAVLRRNAPVEVVSSGSQNVLKIGNVEIDSLRKSVIVNGQPVQFSKKEFEILNLLASNQGSIFSREDLINELWQYAPYVLDRTVDVHIARIRSKLGECKGYLTNRSGYAYTFNPVD